MKCPVDGAVLEMSERQGVEIDYCPTCRGVWLDRGELDKMLERAETWSPAGGSPERSDDRRGFDPAGRKKKRKSFLSDLFED